MSIFPFMFLDKEPPFYGNTCLRNMVFHAPSKCAASAVVSWKEPIATDNSGHVTISYPALRPPANLSIGLHYVRYSAVDDEGNRANCTLVVQVVSMSQIQYFTEICYVKLSIQSFAGLYRQTINVLFPYALLDNFNSYLYLIRKRFIHLQEYHAQ